MADKSGIEWTDATWNPVTGCTEVSPGCDRCYAKTFAERWRGTPGHYFEQGFDVVLRPDKLDLPLRWKKPRRIFVNSMSDLFHDEIPDTFILQVFSVMQRASRHTFQVLTKRHGRMRSLLPWIGRKLSEDGEAWPLPNVWLGVSVENQQWADIRIPALLDSPAAVRFLSCEPLLGAVNLSRWLDLSWPALCWVIVGGESGHGARPMYPEWARSLRDQCTAAGVPFLFKQWGEWAPQPAQQMPNGGWRSSIPQPLAGGALLLPSADDDKPWTEHTFPRPREAMVRPGKKAAGRELDGRTWDEFPQAVNS